MKKLAEYIAIVLMISFILSIFPINVDAKQGCCSWHGGVCGSRCCDGTPLSAKCGGSDTSPSNYDCNLDTNNNLICGEGGPCIGSMSYCQPELECINYRCTKKVSINLEESNVNSKGVGDVCSYSFECVDSLVCINGKCIQKNNKDEGEECTSYLECKGSLYCQDGYCINIYSKKVGQKCIVDNECDVLLNCVHNVCRTEKTYCGDNYCDNGEMYKCSRDCDWCGDGKCSKEEELNCKEDCRWCGDSVCNNQETCSTCQEDCVSTDSKKRCENGKFVYYCGNNQCDKGEDCSNCLNDCWCRNSKQRCEKGKCVYYCGNGQKDKNENCENCPKDVICSELEICSQGVCKTYCGNGVCEAEEQKICIEDCRWCGDNRCDELEIGACLIDCGLDKEVASNKIVAITGFSISEISLNEEEDYYSVNTTNRVKLFGVLPLKIILFSKIDKLNGSVEGFHKPWWFIFVSSEN